jgi:hypothetical protein
LVDNADYYIVCNHAGVSIIKLWLPSATDARKLNGQSAYHIYCLAIGIDNLKTCTTWYLTAWYCR